jgi:hypothetical protein
MNHGLWKQIAFGLLVLVIGSIALLRVEVLSVWLHAPNPHTDDAGVSVMLSGSSTSTLISTSTCTDRRNRFVP